MKVTKKDLIKLADILLDVERIYRVWGFWTDKYKNHPQKKLEHKIFTEEDFLWWSCAEGYEDLQCEILRNAASLLYSEAQVM